MEGTMSVWADIMDALNKEDIDTMPHRSDWPPKPTTSYMKAFVCAIVVDSTKKCSTQHPIHKN